MRAKGTTRPLSSALTAIPEPFKFELNERRVFNGEERRTARPKHKCNNFHYSFPSVGIWRLERAGSATASRVAEQHLNFLVQHVGSRTRDCWFLLLFLRLRYRVGAADNQGIHPHRRMVVFFSSLSMRMSISTNTRVSNSSPTPNRCFLKAEPSNLVRQTARDRR